MPRHILNFQIKTAVSHFADESQKNEPPPREPGSSHNNNDSGDDQKRPKSPQQQSPGGFSFWMVMAVVFGGIFIASMFIQGPRQDIPISSLIELIEKGPPAEGKDPPYIDVKEGEGKNEITVRYSNLQKIILGPNEIRGTVTREVVSPVAKVSKPVENVKFSSGITGFGTDNNEFQQLLKGFEYSAEKAPSPLTYYGPTLLMLLILIPLMIFVFRRIGGSGAIAFGKNRGRQVAQEDVEITFEDVAGVDEAVDELKEIVAFLKTPEKYKVLGGRIPRGVLLVGPPGTGKTILAKAVAGEAGVPFFSLSGSDFVELYVGVGAARVRDLFVQAERQTPCIIFIDELDALGKARTGNSHGAHDEREQTLNALLVEMDGIGTNTGIIVMGATNRPETLDSALLRAGRFDRHVLVDRPDIRGREAILKVHAKHVKLDPSIDLSEIASITSGFVGADLAALVNEAALLAARAGKKTVTMEEFSEGVERVTAGLQKKQRVIRQAEKDRIAAHESGHALVAYSLPGADPVHKVSIIPRGLAALGYTLQRPDDDRYLMTQQEIETRIQVLLGGTIAEELMFEHVSTGAQNDLERATELARSMVMDFGMSKLGRVNFRENPRGMFIGESGMIQQRLHSEKTAWEIDQEIKSIIEEMYAKTKELLVFKKETLERLSDRLLEKEILDTDELKAVIENDPLPEPDGERG